MKMPKIPVSTKPDKYQEYKELIQFGRMVEIILHTTCEAEYQAALEFLYPPTQGFDKCVRVPSAIFSSGIVLGTFAGHYTALVCTAVGEPCLPTGCYRKTSFRVIDDLFFTKWEGNIPGEGEDKNAIYEEEDKKILMISVGSCIAFNSKKHKVGDVLVSKRINEFTVRNKKDNVYLLKSLGVDKTLYKAFCINSCFDEDFPIIKPDPPLKEVDPCCPDLDNHPPPPQGRPSKVYAGTFACFPEYMEAKDLRDELIYANPEGIGIRADNSLMRFKRNERVIIINGVHGYGDGVYDDDSITNDWKYTASRAALAYARNKLYYYRNDDYEIDDTRKSPWYIYALCETSAILIKHTHIVHVILGWKFYYHTFMPCVKLVLILIKHMYMSF